MKGAVDIIVRMILKLHDHEIQESYRIDQDNNIPIVHILVYITIETWKHHFDGGWGGRGGIGSTNGFSSRAWWSNLSNPLSLTAFWMNTFTAVLFHKIQRLYLPAHTPCTDSKSCRTWGWIRPLFVSSTPRAPPPHLRWPLLARDSLQTRNWNTNRTPFWEGCIQGIGSATFRFRMVDLTVTLFTCRALLFPTIAFQK